MTPKPRSEDFFLVIHRYGRGLMDRELKGRAAEAVMLATLDQEVNPELIEELEEWADLNLSTLYVDHQGNVTVADPGIPDPKGVTVVKKKDVIRIVFPILTDLGYMSR